MYTKLYSLLTGKQDKDKLMEEIEWSDEYSVGIEAIDNQHKILLKMINSIIRTHDTTANPETVTNLISDMTKYAQEHFSAEENIMKENGYSKLDKHIEEHQAFIEKTVDLCSATYLEIGKVPAVLLNFLKEWLKSHILKTDMELKNFFNEKTINSNSIE